MEASITRYLTALDTADRQDPDMLSGKVERLQERLVHLRERMQHLHRMKATVDAAPGRQISLTDPDARAMATSSKSSGLVGYNVQAAVDTEHHLIVAHQVTNATTTDRSWLR